MHDACKDISYIHVRTVNEPVPYLEIFLFRHPIAYYNANKGSNPWRKVSSIARWLRVYLSGNYNLQTSPLEVLTHYLLPVLFVAILTNAPRFLEMEHVWDTVEKTVEDPFTGDLHTVILVVLIT